jgi:hypothetical protein
MDDSHLPYGAQVAAQLQRNIALGDVASGVNDWCAHATTHCFAP